MKDSRKVLGGERVVTAPDFSSKGKGFRVLLRGSYAQKKKPEKLRGRNHVLSVRGQGTGSHSLTRDSIYRKDSLKGR